MLEDSTVLARMRTLGAVRSLMPKLVFEGAFAADEDERRSHTENMVELALGSQLITDSLGLELAPEHLLPFDEKYDAPAELLLNDLTASLPLRVAIAEQFGDWPAFQFMFAQGCVWLRRPWMVFCGG